MVKLLLIISWTTGPMVSKISFITSKLHLWDR